LSDGLSGRFREFNNFGATALYADLRGLPPTLIQVGSEETLLDDATRFSAAAGAAEVPMTLEILGIDGLGIIGLIGWYVSPHVQPQIGEAIKALQPPVGAGYDDGVASYRRGDYAAALDALLPAAEAGGAKEEAMQYYRT
jgi:hypothetical protein